MSITKIELAAKQLHDAAVKKKIWGDVIINVGDYGAEGDWNETTGKGTDNTAAFQAAINDAISKGKSDLWLPPGSYKYTTLMNSENITFYGDSVTLHGTTLLYVSSFNAMRVRLDNIVANAGSSNTEIVDARLPEVGAAYVTLKARLDAERHALNAADEAEIIARAAGDTAEQVARIAGDNAEQAARLAGDASLSARIDHLVVTGGTGNPEVLDARLPASGSAYGTLKLRLDASDAQLADKAKQADVDLKDYKGYGKVTLPSDFAPILAFYLYRDFDGLVKHTWNVSQFETGALTLYCNSNTGSDGNTGAIGSPFATIKKAMQAAAAAVETTVLIKVTGKMLKDASTDTAAAITFTNKTIAIIPDTGETKTTLSGGVSSQYPVTQKITWTADGGAYSAPRTNAYNVFNMGNRDLYGVAKPLEWASSLAACQATLNTWYTDSTTVWVNVGSVPSANILIAVNTPTFNVTLSNSTLYIRDLEFYSGNFLGNTGHACNITGDINSTVVLNKCIFAGGEARGADGVNGRVTNGMSISNVGKTYCFECVGAYTRRDVFNYHYSGIATGSRRSCLVFEYRCIAYGAGRYDLNVNNNATTAHEGVSTLRVSGIGYECCGPQCADVNGCYSIVIDGSYRDSTSSPLWDNCAGYYFDNASALQTGKAILINCEGGSQKYSISGDTGFDIRVRNFIGKKIKSDLVLTYL